MPTHIVMRSISGSSARGSVQFPLGQSVDLVIGRDPSAALVFDSADHSMVSRRHAVLRIIAGRVPRFRVADLRSNNGTIVNGRAIDGEQEIRPGDTIQLGGSGPKFTFELYPPDEQGMASALTPAVDQAGSAGWPPYVDDLEAFAMAAAAREAPWPDQAIGGQAPARAAATAEVSRPRTRFDVLAVTLAALAAGMAGLYFAFSLLKP